MDTTDVKLLRAGIARRIADADMWPTWRDKQKLEVFRELVSDKFTDEQIAHSYFKLPTGYGKTVMFARMAHAYFDEIAMTGAKRQKIIIIVPRLSLIDQTKEKLQIFANITATEYSGQKKNINSDVVITTYNSLGKLFGVVDFNDVGLIFADEAHHMLGEKISERLAFYNRFVPIIGFTATPEYEANRAVANMLNTEIFAMNIPDAVKIGILSPIKNILYRSSIVCDLSNIPATSTGDYDYKNIKTQISPETLVREIARIYVDGFDKDTGTKFSTLKAIINCPTAEIANLQAAKINEIMGRDVAISLHKVGISDKLYNRLKGEFESGRYTVACQVGTLTEGFDDETVSMCINYPTRSRVKAEQTGGRVIRLDENNPDKIAFIVDTVFRATKNEAPEEILYTASNSKQVLFKDIADGNIVLYPQDFKPRLTNTTGRTMRSHGDVEFVDFDLITDSATLIELNHVTKNRIADEIVPQKTEEWLSANDLVKDKDFPSARREKINDAMTRFEHDPEFKGFIQEMKTAGKICKCLHKSKKQAFAERAGFKTCPQKTDEWLSAYYLVKDKDFPSSRLKKINDAMTRFEHDPEFKGFIQEMKISGRFCKCIHKSKKQAFAERAGYKTCPQKTDEWLSAYDLSKDKDFPINSPYIIIADLNKLEHDPEFKGFIQEMRTETKISKCIHKSKKQRFAERSGYKTCPQKTDEWLSAYDLVKDKDFPSARREKINDAMTRFEHDPEFKVFIQEMKTAGKICKCLHKSKKQAFAERAGFKTCPQKTDEWLSANDLAKDKDFPSTKLEKINDAMTRFEHDPEFKGFIQEMKTSRRICKCLHKSKKQAFAERAGFTKKRKILQSLQDGTKVVGAINVMQDIENSIKPDNQHKM